MKIIRLLIVKVNIVKESIKAYFCRATNMMWNKRLFNWKFTIYFRYGFSMLRIIINHLRTLNFLYISCSCYIPEAYILIFNYLEIKTSLNNLFTELSLSPTIVFRLTVNTYWYLILRNSPVTAKLYYNIIIHRTIESFWLS